MKVFSVFLTLLFALATSAADKPNIVFIIADDMGYADISSFGAPDVKTPAIDQIAKDGIRFTNVYGATTMLFASPKAVISDCPPNTPVWLQA
jgi:hypothetical protein